MHLEQRAELRLITRALQRQYQLPGRVQSHGMSIVLFYKGQRQVDAGRYSAGSVHIAVARIKWIRVHFDRGIPALELLTEFPVRGGLFAIQDTSFGQCIRAYTNRPDAAYFGIDVLQPLKERMSALQLHPGEAGNDQGIDGPIDLRYHDRAVYFDATPGNDLFGVD